LLYDEVCISLLGTGLYGHRRCIGRYIKQVIQEWAIKPFPIPPIPIAAEPSEPYFDLLNMSTKPSDERDEVEEQGENAESKTTNVDPLAEYLKELLMEHMETDFKRLDNIEELLAEEHGDMVDLVSYS
jgi:hypothetical protein